MDGISGLQLCYFNYFYVLYECQNGYLDKNPNEATDGKTYGEHYSFQTCASQINVVFFILFVDR
mgnify:CR=1 FL=1